MKEKEFNKKLVEAAANIEDTDNKKEKKSGKKSST